MKILYLDTSSSYLYFGVVENNSLLFEVKENLATDLSKYALPKIVESFEKYELKPEDIDKIILVNGPGSFTGVRIGITIAKTYAWGLNIPIVTISSLEAMAISCPIKEDFNYIIPMIDARRGYVYAGIYDSNYNSIMKDQYIKLDALQVAANQIPGNVIYITNDNFDQYITTSYSPNILAIVNHCKDRPCENPHAIDANYLKLTEAEEKMSE